MDGWDAIDGWMNGWIIDDGRKGWMDGWT